MRKAVESFAAHFDWLALHFTDGTTALVKATRAYEDAEIDTDPGTPDTYEIVKLGIATEEEGREAEQARQDALAKKDEAHERVLYEKLRAKFEK